MNLEKYEFPNFFIRKKYNNNPGTFNLSGYIYYINQHLNSDRRFVSNWGITKPDFPGGRVFITQTGATGLSKSYVEENFYHVNRLEPWKKEMVLAAIFSPEGEKYIQRLR